MLKAPVHLTKHQQEHANKWLLHYLSATGIYSLIGLHMCQEVQEILERRHNEIESDYYVD